MMPSPTSSVLDVPVSLFRGVYDNGAPEESPLLSEVLTRMQQGVWRDTIAKLRHTLRSRGEAAYKRAKEQLLALTPACAMRTRDRNVPLADRVASPSNIVHFDLDKLADHAHVKALLRQNPHVAFVFTSPRGNGLKIGIATTGITTENYKQVWYGIRRELQQRYPDGEFVEDNSIQYINALCFVSDDPELYCNPQAVPLVVPTQAPDAEAPLPEPDPLTSPPAAPNYATVSSALACIPPDDYQTWFRVGVSLKRGGQPWARAVWEGWSQQSAKYQAVKDEHKWEQLPDEGNIHPYTILNIAHEHGWRPAGWGSPSPEGVAELSSQNAHTACVLSSTDSAAPLQAQTGTGDLSSLNSLSSQLEWPTIRPEAFYGLAKDIVEAITPQSEADPIAILVQLLAYAGAVSGHSAAFTVEATRHTTNIFACLVGNTSRARKGTSYDYVEQLMQQADPTWSLNNVTGSCGSGEGLIAAVRDPIYRRDPIKEKGRVVDYQEIETDPGVTDKRLLVYEAEFSSLLKVANREGSILSETLRKAWDSGNLRNPVKTSPLKATGAHISLLGHITIEELQRTLTTTEAANGFGNRILWVCVKRAQTLPDGGVIPAETMAPLITQLTHAMATAKTITRMRRDDAARVAWHAVYAALTTDHPGMAGTLIARAEAQVVRLSMLYALLDRSAVIRAEHLTAALALWEYCEASVRYLFGTTLGDADADTLLAALQECYPKGLSRKYVMNVTFHGHLRADMLDRVVRLLAGRRQLRVEQHTRAQGYGRGREMFYALECELSELSSTDYVSMSKDAAKRSDLSSQEARKLCELSSDTSATAAPPTPAFTALTASEVWCPTCKSAQKVTLVGRAYRCQVCQEIVAYVSGDDMDETTAPAPDDPPAPEPAAPTADTGQARTTDHPKDRRRGLV